MANPKVAFIGGSGLYHLDGLADETEVSVKTPFGRPSDDIITGTIDSVPVAFLPRHGRGHRYSPTEIPVRANIYALKTLGVDRIVSISAVGSLREEIKPLDMVVPNQIIDHTTSRSSSFFGGGIVAHVGFADPFCPNLRTIVVEAALKHNDGVHTRGTYLVMEGPQFSTRAESELYRSWGASVIGMTALPEAKLAREAEICYATIALVTDYDCWHEVEEDVSVELVVANLKKNSEASQELVKDLLPQIPGNRDCVCSSALKDAIITSLDEMDKETKERLSPIVGKYFPEPKIGS